MLSKATGSPDRVDVPLTPGINRITVEQEVTHLKATVEPPPPRK